MASGGSIYFLSTDATFGSTGTSAAAHWQGGRGVITAISTSWNSATASLEMLSLHTGSTTYVPVSASAVLAADGAFGFELPPCMVRLAVSGSPTTIKACARGTGVD